MSIHVSYRRSKLTLLTKDVIDGEPQSQSGRDAMIGHLEELKRPRIAAARRRPAAVGAHRRIPLQMSSRGHQCSHRAVVRLLSPPPPSIQAWP